MKPPDSIANFDSASAMTRATAAFLRGEDFPLLRMMNPWMTLPAKVYGTLVNHLPASLREQVYIWSGWGEAVSTDRASEIDIEHIAQWAVSEYPQDRTYPAVAVGSSNGALVHMHCAMGIPWLGQTFMVPIRRGRVHPDDPGDDIEKCKPAADAMLEANPDVVLHQMHDPNQDRLMVERMAYFRVKKTTLGPSYERFLRQTLEPGGTIYLVECGLQWPTTRISDRHVFQFGALGGATSDEFLHGSERVAAYLKRYGSHRTSWDPPTPDADRPEAEWGFEPAMRDDVLRFAREHGYRVKRIIFEQPDHTSPLVADFYRQWNRRREISDNRLLVSSFILMDPYLTVQTGSVPYWMVFNKEPSADDLEQYLDTNDPFDEINMMLFSHGVNSVGLAPIERWRAILDRAKVRGRFIGVDQKSFPRDFAVFARFHDSLRKSIPQRYPIPDPVEPDAFEQFIEQPGGKYHVQLAAGEHVAHEQRHATDPTAPTAPRT